MIVLIQRLLNNVPKQQQNLTMISDNPLRNADGTENEIIFYNGKKGGLKVTNQLV